MDILAKFGTIPKNHMQILTDDELNYIFDSLTQENQTVDINEALMAQLKRQEVKPVPKKEGKPAEKTPVAKPAVEESRPSAPAASPAQEAPAPAKPAAAQQQAGQKPAVRQTNSRQSRFENAAPMQQRQSKRDRKKPQQRREQPVQNVIPRGPETDDTPAVAVVSEAPKSAQKQRYVDTRGTSVNLDRYDERIDSLVPDRAQNMTQSSKQKLTKKNTDRRSFGSKRRNEEQEKLRRLQQEVAKAKPLKVLIPDEIAVGELVPFNKDGLRGH